MRRINLQTDLERYIIKREGLHGLVPKASRTVVFSLPWPCLMSMLAALAALPVYFLPDQRSLTSAALAFVANLAAFVLVAYLLTYLRFDHFYENEDDLEQLTLIIVVISSVGVASAAGLLSQRVDVAGLAALLYIGSALVVSALSWQTHHVHTILGSVRLAIRTAPKSTAALAFLMSLSLVACLLVTFTQELWESLARVHVSEIPAVVGLAFLPVLLLIGRVLQQDARAVLKRIRNSVGFDGNSLADAAPEVLFKALKCDASSFHDGVLLGAQTLLRRLDAEALSEVADVVERRVKLMLVLLYLVSACIHTLALTVYFSLLFPLLFKDDAVRALAALGGPGQPALPVLFGIKGELLVIWQVSFLLSVFVSSITSMQVLTGKNLHDFYREWLREDVKRLLTLGSLYRSFRSSELVTAPQEVSHPALT